MDRPVDVVAAYAADPSNVPHWYSNISSVRWETLEGDVRVGARAAFVARFLGRTLDYTYEITSYEPGAVLVMRTAQGPFPMETTYGWEDTALRRDADELRNRGEPAGFSRLLAPIVAHAIRRANGNDLDGLHRILESAPRS